MNTLDTSLLRRMDESRDDSLHRHGVHGRKDSHAHVLGFPKNGGHGRNVNPHG